MKQKDFSYWIDLSGSVFLASFGLQLWTRQKKRDVAQNCKRFVTVSSFKAILFQGTGYVDVHVTTAVEKCFLKVSVANITSLQSLVTVWFGTSLPIFANVFTASFFRIRWQAQPYLTSTLFFFT
jgi:hypothetical protein